MGGMVAYQKRDRMQVLLLASCFFGDLLMFSTPHPPLSEEVFVEKELSFFVSSCPLKCNKKSAKPLGSWDVRLCTNGHLVSKLAFSIWFWVFFGQLHTLPHSCLFHLPVQRNGQNACVSRVSGVFGLFLRAGSSEKTFFQRDFFRLSDSTQIC